MKAMKLGMIWVLVGMGLAMVLSVWVLVFAQSVRALESTDPVLVGAGDIASCGRTGDEATASLLSGINGTVATLGDNAYESGTSTEFSGCYDPSWGVQKARTMPSVGNHEYYDLSGVAQPYFDYFSAKNGFQLPAAPVPNDPVNDNNHGLTVGEGYYSYDLGSWHVVVLNSNCDKVGGCGPGSPQEAWLRKDLANTTNKQCTLAYFHHPRFSSSGIGNNSAVAPFWKALYDAGAEVVLNGHAHNYERFAPQDSNGNADPDYGIREFIVGTGGRSLNSFGTPQPNSEVRLTDDDTSYISDGLGKGKFGVIKLTLHPGSYEWKYVQIDGTVDGMDRDPSVEPVSCHGEPPTSTTDRPGSPSITKTDPGTNATGVATTKSVTASFSEEMDRTTINGKTFKLFKKGTSTKIPATVTYFPDDKATTDTVEARATLDPTSSLQNGVTYKAVVTTGAKDSVGNPLPQQYKWFFTTG